MERIRINKRSNLTYNLVVILLIVGIVFLATACYPTTWPFLTVILSVSLRMFRRKARLVYPEVKVIFSRIYGFD